MGSRNPDRIPLSHRYNLGKTVADMLAQRWDVVSKCHTCGLEMQTDLKLIIRVSGPNVSLWNRKARCRRRLCQGFVEFYAKAPGMDGHQALRVDERAPVEPTWAQKWEANRAKLKEEKKP